MFVISEEFIVCGYVSDCVRSDFTKREKQVTRLIQNSGIRYTMVGLFGSYARNNYKTTSDLDFCIVCDERPSHTIAGILRDEAELLGADVTIVTTQYFNEDTSEFAKQLRRDFRRVL